MLQRGSSRVDYGLVTHPSLIIWRLVARLLNTRPIVKIMRSPPFVW